MYWLTGALILFVEFGLLRMQISVSKIMQNEDGKFEVVRINDGFFMWTDEKFHKSKTISKQFIDQKSHTAKVSNLSLTALVLAISYSAIFSVTLF